MTSPVRVLGAPSNIVREVREGIIALPIVRLGPRSTVTLNAGVRPKPMFVDEFKVDFTVTELMVPPTWMEHIVIEEIRTEDNYDPSKHNQLITAPNIKVETWHPTPDSIEETVRSWRGQLDKTDDELRAWAAEPVQTASLPIHLVMGDRTLVHCRFRNPTDEERIASAMFRGKLVIDKPEGYSVDPRADRLRDKLLERLDES